MAHVIYKTTNLINGHYYIGKHSKNDPNYLGSRIAIIRAIKKYGRENFVREILATCSSEEEAYLLEADIVTIDIIEDKNCYNLVTGGNGSREFSEISKEKMRDSQLRSYLGEQGNALREKRSIAAKNKPPKTEETRKKLSSSLKGKKKPAFTEEHKQNLSKAAKGKLMPIRTKKHCKNLSLARLGKKQPLAKCPHCNKEGGAATMQRWHFDNCREQ